LDDENSSREESQIWGNIDNHTVKDERVINVPAGGICTETLKLS
jgi:hypothetical protein